MSSHLAMATFCWLPPLRKRTGISGLAMRIASRSRIASVAASTAAGEMTPLRETSGSVGKRDVLVHREGQDQPLRLAVLRDQRQPRRHRVARTAEANRLAVDADVAVDPGVDTEEGEEQIALPLTFETGETEDLALVDDRARCRAGGRPR